MVGVITPRNSDSSIPVTIFPDSLFAATPATTTARYVAMFSIMLPKLRFRRRAVVVTALAATTLVLYAVSRRFGAPGEPAGGSRSEFVGAARCATCHASEYSDWKTSQHSVAMQYARPTTVLGRFDSTRFTQPGVTSTFFRRDDRYFVNTEGADGKLRDFEIQYTFGVWPLQQYLVEMGSGRVQSLALAWDARPTALGGQRWFSLDTVARVTPADALHWTGRALNWNHMCADCHSTGVRKGYDAATDEFHTTRAEINVACEACHGPGSNHAARMAYPRWVRRIAWRDEGGLPARLTERRDVRWSIDSATGSAHRNTPRTTDREIETCAQCHARRLHVADGYTAGAPWMDFYDPELLVAGLYYPDGQQRAEVFTYGSFLQSRMYAAGVTCADCHDPHTQRLRRPGNAVCTQCHRAATYDSVAHHFHAPATAGAQCVSCHMPATTYMKIDPRHDHSMRVPRPDLSVSIGVPNACSRCHADRDAVWAATQVRAWRGRTPTGFQRFAGAFAADDRGMAGAVDSLAGVANDSSQPAIVRASALVRLGGHPGPSAFQAAQRWSLDKSALVRRAALQILETFPPTDRVAVALPLLRDGTRAVRLEAAWLVAPMADSLPTTAERLVFADAATEFVASARYNADRTVSRLTLGSFYALRGRLDSASAEYRAALRLDPRSAQAYLYLAEVLRVQGRRLEAERTIRDGLKELPKDRDLLYALATFLRGAGDVKTARRQPPTP
jgi:predicted CXXCH cytochrome family protein